MNRLAIFTEGETEQLFVEWLVREMISAANLKIELRRARGGRSTRRRTRIVEAVADDPVVKYYVLIVDCGGDGGVKSRILEEYHRLAEFGYKAAGSRATPCSSWPCSSCCWVWPSSSGCLLRASRLPAAMRRSKASWR